MVMLASCYTKFKYLTTNISNFYKTKKKCINVLIKSYENCKNEQWIYVAMLDCKNYRIIIIPKLRKHIDFSFSKI